MGDTSAQVSSPSTTEMATPGTCHFWRVEWTNFSKEAFKGDWDCTGILRMAMLFVYGVDVIEMTEDQNIMRQGSCI